MTLSSSWSHFRNAAQARSLSRTSPITVPTNTSLPAAKRVLGLKHNSLLISGISFLSAALANNSRQHRPLSPRRGAVFVLAAWMESKEVPLAFRAPALELPEPLTGKTWKLDDFEDQQGLLVMFICNHCPFVIHLKESLANFAHEYQEKGLGVVAISSNSVETHPQFEMPEYCATCVEILSDAPLVHNQFQEDGPKYMAEDAKKYGYGFPYLYDETQEVAKAYGAVCTPDFFLFKKDGRNPFELAYHGRYDETRPRTNATPTGRELKAAVNALLSAQPIPSDQKPR